MYVTMEMVYVKDYYYACTLFFLKRKYNEAKENNVI